MTWRVVVVGDVMLDREVDGTVERFCPDAPAPVLDVTSVLQGPGGAGLATLLCAAPDIDVTWIGPLADDEDGAAIERELAAAGVSGITLGHAGPTRRKTRVRSGGHVIVRLDEGGPGRPTGLVPHAALDAIAEADVVLASCYGAGATLERHIRAALTRRAAAHRPVIWDPHPRGGPPVPGCLLVAPNVAEARAALARPDDSGEQVVRAIRDLWDARFAAVTGGVEGAWLAVGDDARHVKAAAAGDGDPCGAGDRFVAAATSAIARGATVEEAVSVAVARAGDWVASGGAWAFRRSAYSGPRPEDGGATRGLRGTGGSRAERHTTSGAGRTNDGDSRLSDVG